MPPLSVRLIGDTQVEVVRHFDAAPAQVYRAHTDPDLLPLWMTGPDGWRMTECVSDLRPGGGIRFAWADDKGAGFHLTGEYLEIEPGARIVHVERMFLPDATPDNRVETRFEADGNGTRLVMTMTVPSADVRQAMLDTGMTVGMEASYARLEARVLVAA